MFAGKLASRTTLGVAVVCTACAGNSAPKGWLPKPTEARETAYGGWVELTYLDQANEHQLDGELIAVTAESVWVLNESGGLGISTSAVKKGKLTAYTARKGGLTGWTVAGALSTASNGAFLIFTAPMWIIGGSLATGAESRAPERKSPPLPWVGLASFARFPQGLPQGVELSGLSTKKVPSQVERRP